MRACGHSLSTPHSGEDAVKFESLPDNVVVAKAMAVLRSIFGDQTVPEVCSIASSLLLTYCTSMYAVA